MAAGITAAYVRKNRLVPALVPDAIGAIHGALSSLQPTDQAAQTKTGGPKAAGSKRR